jgi:oxygen-dependent protoporphyrinogen oxidase
VLAIEPASIGFRVLTDDGAIDAAQIVLTCGAGEAARLLGFVAPDAAAELNKLVYNPIALVHMLADGVTRGMGYQVSFAEDLLTRGVTFNHALFGRDRIYTAFLGGARDRAIARRADAEIAEVATREFLQVTGRPAAALHVARAVIPAWDRSWIALDQLTLPDGIHICANYESRIGIPGRITRARQLAALIAD